ncbi:MAG TPA: UDPGP type 1 family protein [Tepidisphaeraceae bacterium]|nr:UDPGP type 1 family protein [Tepidisphaeraceae bacterium]
MNLSDLRNKLTSVGQGHVLQFFDQLGESSKQKLIGQLEALDLNRIDELVKTQVKVKAAISLPHDIKPVDAFPRHADEKHRQQYQDAQKRGHELLKQGKIAAFLVAGGQGTRLGYDGPKGEYPVTPVKNKPLFQVFAEQLLAHSRAAGHAIPWYIMTSDANDAATRTFFKKHNYFGYDSANIMFFQQGMMPAFSMDGKMLLAAKDSLALSPDGHGGSFRALETSGALADMQKRGVEHLSYFQVDNPLVHCIDPLFLGLHDLAGSEMSSKTIPKAEPLEKVGNFVIGDGKLQVIEYSDLPKEMALQVNADGTPRFNSGSIAIHAVRVSFVHRLNSGGRLNLPWHRAEKKVPFVDASGKEVKPDSPNAIKLEQFVFDAIPLAKNAIVYTTDRSEEFSPVKNARGVDSPATCKRDQIRRAARWLSGIGVEIPAKDNEPDATLEISPLFAANQDQLARRKVSVKSPLKGQTLYIE